MRALQQQIVYESLGKPADVLYLEQAPLPEPEPGEVRLKLLAATINPSDYGMIGGSYGRLKKLPAVAGREGVGEIDALGDGVSGVELGQRVRFAEEGAWREYACMNADRLLKVPTAVPIEQAAVSFINPPTAFCLLKEIVDLEPGSWIVQNAGNSAVGISVIQMARIFGLRTISEVRRAELIEPLKAMGADHVVLEGDDWEKTLDEVTDGSAIRLALNSIGGASAVKQIKALGQGGLQVTFGGMVGDLVRFPTRYLIFNDIRLVGFWWDQWSKRNGPEAVDRVMREIYVMIARGDLELKIEASYPFAEYREALAHDKRPRLGKILLRP